jgi:hypothetical protein
MEPNWMVPSVIVWAGIIFTYAIICCCKFEDGNAPIWTWPGLLLVGLVGLSMVSMLLVLLFYPFYYLIFL